MGNPVAFFRIEVKPYIIPRYSQIFLKSFSSRDEQEQILGGVVISPPSSIPCHTQNLRVKSYFSMGWYTIIALLGNNERPC